jgi:hypothetical protein
MARIVEIDHSGFFLSLQFCFLLLIHGLLVFPAFVLSPYFFIPESPTHDAEERTETESDRASWACIFNKPNAQGATV